MGSTTEVGFVFQCVLCGSFSVFAVDALDPADVSRRAAGAAAGRGQKTLQKDVHAVEHKLLELAQQRVAGLRGDDADAHDSEHYVLLPCASCIEIYTGRTYAEWLDDKSTLASPIRLLPHLAVSFEAGALPPAFVRKFGQWCLVQGVGPKDLEVKLPHQLPAGQFRALLPPVAPPIRPPCWQKDASEGTDAGEDWRDRLALIDAVEELASAPAEEG